MAKKFFRKKDLIFKAYTKKVQWPKSWSPRAVGGLNLFLIEFNTILHFRIQIWVKNKRGKALTL